MVDADNRAPLPVALRAIAVTGDECCGVIPGGISSLRSKGRGGHLAGGVAGGDEALCGQVEGMGLAMPRGTLTAVNKERQKKTHETLKA